MTIFCLGASLSCKISLTPRKRRTQRQQKKHRREKKKGKNINLVGAVIFFASKPLSAALFGCFRVRRIIWCVNSRLFSLLFSLGSERHTKTRRRQRRRRKRKTLRFVVNWFPSRSSFRDYEKRRNFCCIYRERGNFFARRVSQTYISSERSNRNFCAQIPRIISAKRGPNDTSK